MGRIKQDFLELHIRNGQDHTFRSLCRDYNADATQERQIDRTLQKLRRKKLAAFRRVGRVLIWKATDHPQTEAEEL